MFKRNYDSIVYLAINNNNNDIIKIGETSDLKRRTKQLKKQDYTVIQWVETYHPVDCRLFVESSLRAILSNSHHIHQYKKDYFYTPKEKTTIVQKNFKTWVNDLVKTYEDIIERYHI